MNPFDLQGPAFLVLYVTVLAGAVIAAMIARWLLRSPGDEAPVEALDLSPYEIAYLSGRERLAVDAAIVRLLNRGALALDGSKGRLAQHADKPLGDAHALEMAVYGAAGTDPGTHVNKVHWTALGTARGLRDRLQTLGLVVTPRQALGVRLVSTGLLVLAGLFGLAKVFVGVERHRPVGILIALLVVTAIVALVFLLKRPFRSRRGDALLAQMKSENAALAFAVARRGSELGEADLVLALGLFGLGALAGSSLAPMYTALQAAQIRAARGGALSSTYASSCGGGGCGAGGGGCGGGGCGGGCGGCGGCGGG